MKTIDLDRARELRARWDADAKLLENEAERRGGRAEADAAKYHATHKQAARNARSEARALRAKIDVLDELVSVAQANGKIVGGKR